MNSRLAYSRPWLTATVLSWTVVWATACQPEPAPAPPALEYEATEQTAAVTSPPDDYVILLDNSGSIRGNQQVILREAVKVLADIVLPGDRVAVVTFDREARLILVQDIEGPRDRRAVRETVDAQIDFSGSHSDMTAGFRVLAEQADQIFRLGTATQNVIILSDGLVESAELDAATALDRLTDLAARDLSFCTFFPIGLGDTSIHEPIVRGRETTGEMLMRDTLTARGGQFFHADSFEGVYPALLSIFVLTKDLADASDAEGRFAADETIERVVIVVPKLDENGDTLAETRDIRFHGPDDVEITATAGPTPFGAGATTRIRWTSSYRFFDLIQIEGPAPGHWRVEVPEAARPGLMFLVHSRTRLLSDPLAALYVNEMRPVFAWVHDDASGAPLEMPLEVTMRVRDAAEPASVLTARLEAHNGRYVVDSTTLVDLGLEAGKTYEYRFRFTGEEGNFFLRHAPWRRLDVLEPLVVVNGAPSSGKTLSYNHWLPSVFAPTTTVTVSASIDSSRREYGELFAGEAPTVVAELFRSSPETGVVELAETAQLEVTQGDGTASYERQLELEPGAYTVRLTARGTDDLGRDVEMVLLCDSIVIIDYGLPIGLGVVGFALVVFLFVLRRIRLRLRGMLEVSTFNEAQPNRWALFDEDTIVIPPKVGTCEVPADVPANELLEGVPAFRLQKKIKLFCFGGVTYHLTALGADLEMEVLDEPVTLDRGSTCEIPAQCEFEHVDGAVKHTVLIRVE